jgi:N-acetylglucosaminyldiphosphoundecaprenol N-acetyl-beta-D-mannosaminyltransferase
VDYQVKSLQSYEGIFYRVGERYTAFLLKLFNFLPSDFTGVQSFDFSSHASSVFSKINNKGLRLAIFGGTEDEVQVFARKIELMYPDINICAVGHGYKSDQEYLLDVDLREPDVVLLSLGNIKQERLGVEILRRRAGKIHIFCCGAFVHQEGRAVAGDYYPRLLSHLRLRFLYRFIKEPHTLKRVIRYYPLFFFKLMRSSTENG